MKRFFLFFLLMLLLEYSFAQGLTAGVKAGVNICNQNIGGSGGLAVYTESFPGYHIGGYLTAMMSDKIGFQPELQYSYTGFNTNVSTDFVRVSYVYIPALLRYNFSKIFSVHAGPQVGILMNAKRTSVSGTSDVKDAYQGTDLGFAFGGIFDLPMGLNITARYSFSLSDIDTFDPSTTKNINFQISVGYRLMGAGD